jgi:hypothetical protein
VNLLKAILAWAEPGGSRIQASLTDSVLLFSQARAMGLWAEIERDVLWPRDYFIRDSPLILEHNWAHVSTEHLYEIERRYRFRGDTVLEVAHRGGPRVRVLGRGQLFGMYFEHRCQRHSDCQEAPELGQACHLQVESITAWLDSVKGHSVVVHPEDRARIEPIWAELGSPEGILDYSGTIRSLMCSGNSGYVL